MDMTNAKTKLSISQATRMVGVARSKFYKDIKSKGISIEGAGTNRPTVDISELIRVYGDRVKTPEKLAEEERRKHTSNILQENSIEEKMELISLREKLRHSEELRQTEKAAAAEQIDLLKKMLDSERSERHQTTALLTDQRGKKEKQAEKLAALERENTAMKNAGLFVRLFGFSKK